MKEIQNHYPSFSSMSSPGLTGVMTKKLAIAFFRDQAEISRSEFSPGYKGCKQAIEQIGLLQADKMVEIDDDWLSYECPTCFAPTWRLSNEQSVRFNVDGRLYHRDSYDKAENEPCFYISRPLYGHMARLWFFRERPEDACRSREIQELNRLRRDIRNAYLTNEFEHVVAELSASFGTSSCSPGCYLPSAICTVFSVYTCVPFCGIPQLCCLMPVVKEFVKEREIKKIFDDSRENHNKDPGRIDMVSPDDKICCGEAYLFLYPVRYNHKQREAIRTDAPNVSHMRPSSSKYHMV